MGTTKTVFDELTVTNAHMLWNGTSIAEELGCTGSLALETEVRTVTKTCEGFEVYRVEIPVSMTGTLNLHMPVETFRKVFGINTDGLQDGVYAYGTQSRQGKGCMTFDVMDVFETMKKLVALPNIIFSGGLNWTLENGGEEVTMTETTFGVFRDEGKNFYYEAMDDEKTAPAIKEGWHKNFNYALVKSAVARTGEVKDEGVVETKTPNARKGGE